MAGLEFRPKPACAAVNESGIHVAGSFKRIATLVTQGLYMTRKCPEPGIVF